MAHHSFFSINLIHQHGKEITQYLLFSLHCNSLNTKYAAVKANLIKHAQTHTHIHSAADGYSVRCSGSNNNLFAPVGSMGQTTTFHIQYDGGGGVVVHLHKYFT